jgi:hypothetical protein
MVSLFYSSKFYQYDLLKKLKQMLDIFGIVLEGKTISLLVWLFSECLDYGGCWKFRLDCGQPLVA